MEIEKEYENVNQAEKSIITDPNNINNRLIYKTASNYVPFENQVIYRTKTK